MKCTFLLSIFQFLENLIKSVQFESTYTYFIKTEPSRNLKLSPVRLARAQFELHRRGENIPARVRLCSRTVGSGDDGWL